ncbi:hypothetical protein KZX29_00215 [Moraxella osloensis]|uniref:hypothetical protein n=1 Tax=Faucicola osloensis TaxID=34062 RepID=UPI002005C5B1|nr:hypothetical protein [Moraxella osloensis]MCK6157231.1 hypothetical protein [Moraxella osloensis]
MAELTPKQRKTFAKITEALQEFPFGATIQDLYNEARLSMTVIKNALEKMDNVEQRGDSWFLKTTDGSRAGEAVEPTVEQPVMQDSAENLQDNTENMQEDIGNTQDAPVNIEDEELNTEAPQVSSPDNESSYPDNGEDTLINPSAEVTNPSDIDTDADQQDTTEVGQIIVSSDDLHPEFAQLPDYQSSNSQAIETASQGLAAELKQLDNAYLDGLASKAEAPNAEVSQATVKHYLLIENCTLSLTQDGTGQEPVLAKDFWVDDEGIELKDSDCQVMKRARMPFINEVEFRGVTYRNLLIVNNAQIFHGVFDSIKAAHDKMAELTAKKCGNFFEVLEV